MGLGVYFLLMRIKCVVHTLMLSLLFLDVYSSRFHHGRLTELVHDISQSDRHIDSI